MTDKQIIAQVLTKANIKYTINKHALLTENFKNKQNTLFVFDEQGNLKDIYNGKDGHKIELLKTDLSVS
jgi:hypothetical protein